MVFEPEAVHQARPDHLSASSHISITIALGMTILISKTRKWRLRDFYRGIQGLKSPLTFKANSP